MEAEPNPEPPQETHWWSRADIWLANGQLSLMLHLLAIGIVIYSLEQSLLLRGHWSWYLLAVIDLPLIIWFIAEHARSLSLAEDRAAWWRSHWWELFGLLPLVVEALPMVGPFVALRLLRLTRVLGAAMRSIGLADMDETSPMHRQLQQLFFIFGCLILAGAFMTYFFEKQSMEACLATVGCDPSSLIRTFPDALWWSITTATTVGYGDVYPTTTGGRIVATFLMITGVGLFGLLAATMSGLIVSNNARASMSGGGGNGNGGGGGVVDELERVSRLRAQGHLNQREFERAKSEILGSQQAVAQQSPVDSARKEAVREALQQATIEDR